MSTTVIVWFRQDLRLDDNPALATAIKSGKAIIPLYIWSPDEEGKWSPGRASRYWLHHALKSLEKELQDLGSRLVISRGPCLETLEKIISHTSVDSVYWNRSYESAAIKRDTRIKKTLRKNGIDVESYNANLLYEPHQIQNKQGSPFRVYTPFWRHYQALEIPAPVGTSVKKLASPRKWPKSLSIRDLGLIPKIKWYKDIDKFWDPRKCTAKDYLAKFLDGPIQGYPKDRDYPAVDGVSCLSPFLHFGQIGPRQIWHSVVRHENKQGRLSPGKAADAWLRQLIWREFAHHLLYHFPETTDKPMYSKFAAFPWKKNRHLLESWQQGKTGYPIVDAGMRQLWKTGWMHNRVRMIVGSFLVKDLLIHWLQGARWFWDTLVDADLANNTLGWQWVAGSGADAAPYFRIFNPVRQGERFDPEGDYVRRWLPELAQLEKKYIHQPWNAPADRMKQAKIQLGKTYPGPIVDHDEARKTALACYQAIKDNN